MSIPGTLQFPALAATPSPPPTGNYIVYTKTDNTLNMEDSLGNVYSFGSTTAISQLTGDVTAIGPGSAAATIEAIQGNAVSGTTGTGDVVFSASPTFTGTLNGASAVFSSTISASNFSGSSSGANTGDVTLTNTNSIALAFSSGQAGLNANLNLSSSGPDVGYIPAVSEIKSDGLLVEVLAGVPVQIGTSNNIGSAASASRSDHVHAITSPVVLGLLLTGYTTGTDAPINATDTLLQGFENLQAQISATTGSAITSLTGDVTATGPGAAAATVGAIQNHPVSSTAPTDAQLLIYSTGTTSWNPTSMNSDASISDTGALTLATVNSNVGSFAGVTVNGKGLVTAAANLSGDATTSGSVITFDTVNSNVGSFGSSSAIPSFTVNAKGLITAASSQQLSLTTGVTGILPIANGGTNNSSAYTAGSVIFSNGTSLTQDNSNFYWNDSTLNLGLGLIPAINTTIDTLNTTGASKAIQNTSYGTGSTIPFRGRFARGTLLSPSAAQSGDTLSLLSGRGYGASQFAAASTGAVNIVAGETFTNTSNLTYLQFQTTPTGSVTATESMRVASIGVTLGPQSSSAAIHQINGGINRTTRTITANLTVDTTTTDDIIFCNASGAITVTLPIPTNGRTLIIKDISGNATTNNITIARHASENIEGLAANYIMQVSYQLITLISDGTNWWVL